MEGAPWSEGWGRGGPAPPPPMGFGSFSVVSGVLLWNPRALSMKISGRGGGGGSLGASPAAGTPFLLLRSSAVSILQASGNVSLETGRGLGTKKGEDLENKFNFHMEQHMASPVEGL